MTSFDLSGIIVKLEDVISEMRILKINMEGRTAQRSYERRRLCGGMNLSCEKSGNMNNLRVNLNEAANYLIQLFYKTGMRYSCTRTKIGKLLSIVSFKYAQQGQQFFEESIYKYDDCGTAIKELTAHVDRDVYIRCNYSDDKKEYVEAIDDTLALPDVALKYCNTDNLKEDAKKVIVEVFRKFASFSARQLGELINPIVNYEGVTRTDGIVDLTIFHALKKEDFQSSEHPRVLIDYLF